MINYETFCRIKHLQNHAGLTKSQIAANLSLDIRTVEKWLQEEHFQPRQKQNRASKLDPFKKYILQQLEKYPYSASQIFQQIREEGFDGGYTIVKEYVRKVRPARKQAYLKLTFAPGECAQVDWGSYGTITIGETRRRLSFFVMVLCYSRLMYLEFTVSQTMEHWLSCHQNAFRFFGGIPQKIMIDNLKSAVLKRAVGQDPVFNPRYLDFAKHYGFSIVPCGVAKGNEKGRVESGVGYIKKNLLAGLQLSSLEALQTTGRIWLKDIANQRIHGATRKQPTELFPLEHLNPLPPEYDCARISRMRVSSQFRISLDGNRYSVPAEYAGLQLDVKIYPDRICAYDQGKLIARHRRSYERNRDYEQPEHPKALLAQRRRARDQQLLKRFLTLFPNAEEYYHELENRRLNPLEHIRRIVALSEIYDNDEVARALMDTFELKAFSSEYIANLLEQRARKMPEPGALQLVRNQDMLDIELPEPDLNSY